MKVIDTVGALRREVKARKKAGQTVALVPTMGALHEGHLTLVRRARELADVVVVSVFVNPLQFGANEDLASYPRTREADAEKLERENVDFLFSPTVDEMYPNGMGSQTRVVMPAEIASIHCGEFRPGHFDGVATVVTKLLGMVQPDFALFGQKDFQQLVVIRRFVRDLSLPVKIVEQETCREKDGLAMSSRNRYLTPLERNEAPELYRILKWTRDAVIRGEGSLDELEATARARLTVAGFHPQYYRICNQSDLQPARKEERELVILAAANLGATRLIDNIVFSRSDTAGV